MVSSDAIRDSLRSVKYPGFSRDIVSFGLVRDISVDAGVAEIQVGLTTADESVPEKIAAAIKSTAGALEGLDDVKVRMEISKPQQQPGPAGGSAGPAPSQAMQRVKYAVAIASGKGGVGKSTVAVNLRHAKNPCGAGGCQRRRHHGLRHLRTIRPLDARRFRAAGN